MNAAEVVETMTKAFASGAPRVALDLTGQNFEDPSTEDLLLELEANFALQRKKIMVIVTRPDHAHLKEQRERMAKLICGSSVITEVAIEGSREGVESLKRFLSGKIHPTTPIFSEIT